MSPFGLNVTPQTPFVWPFKVRKGVPLLVSQSLMALSEEPEARVRPSELKATLKTLLTLPSKVARHLMALVPPLLVISHSLTVLSHEPEARV